MTDPTAMQVARAHHTVRRGMHSATVVREPVLLAEAVGHCDKHEKHKQFHSPKPDPGETCACRAIWRSCGAAASRAMLSTSKNAGNLMTFSATRARPGRWTVCRGRRCESAGDAHQTIHVPQGCPSSLKHWPSINTSAVAQATFIAHQTDILGCSL